ncbi:MAG: transcription-repair coupling factor [Anaerolinea sp.]|nr:transcription-repair coupling factor [Anaerolinea sp.]
MRHAVLEQLQAQPAYQALVKAVRSGQALSGLGLLRAARLPLLAALWADLRCPMLLVADRMDRALTVQDELGFWSADAPRLLFPEPNPMFYEQAAWGSNTRRERLQVLTALAQYHIPGQERPKQPPMIITSLRALMTRTLPRRDFLKHTRSLKVGQMASPEMLQRTWVEVGYQAAEVVLEPGQFSRRGGLLDVWVPAEKFPVRLEFFGDEIDLLRRFDPATQRTVEKIERLTVTPAREVLPGKATQLPEGVEVDEFYLPVVHPAHASLLDYLPKDALVVVGDMDLLQSIAGEIEEQAVQFRQESVAEGTLTEDFPVPYLSWSEIQDMLSGQRFLELGHGNAEQPGELAEVFQPEQRFGGRLKQFVEQMLVYAGRGEQVMVVSRQVPRLRELWTEYSAQQVMAVLPEFVEGSLGEGWAMRCADGGVLHVLTDSEVFGWERPLVRQRHRPVVEAPEALYADLRPGDWVVHVDYGIGRYTGLVRRVLEGVEREFLCVEYEGGSQLFVPVYQADRLSRYVGPDAEPPSPTRLGTPEWNQAKQRVREEVLKVAQDLLELYARRHVAQGVAFGADTPWQKELEASFPYVETADQLKAIEDVKRDMERSRPMDRLLCGDVGYGKTEVALRAAFKAVMGGKQVAVLVPTTVLAQQHYETFRQRLAAFPVQVEMLSRFRSQREQDAIVRRLGMGQVDIIIGTHRLLQPDVTFKDLGLVIVDEEQRFGVTHKEHFKKLRTEVDVLTLTATPIPRTLYMALTGVRDISTINTPPEERLPIITHIGPYSPRLVRQAILREMERGGQVFFVHNRVQTIGAMEQHLHHLVPEARVGVAHGQMNEAQLSQVMEQFTRGELDVLLCTSIIESGLDIPNANTLIVDRGDTFGLAQLYQLRGRVGRGAQRAYAYFFRHRKKPPTAEGQERLEVIAENSQLGAGYSIAMRDLEMRGAGEMLGMRQSGYIATVGFHLYTRLLAQAVRQLRQARGMPALEQDPVLAVRELVAAVAVEFPLTMDIPADYIPDQRLRLSLYRRMADITDEQSLDLLRQEFQDRFGPLPEPVANLFFQFQVRLRAQRAGLAAVTVEGEQIVLRYPPLPEGVTRSLQNLAPLARSGRNAYWMAFGGDVAIWKGQLLAVLNALVTAKEANHGEDSDH